MLAVDLMNGTTITATSDKIKKHGKKNKKKKLVQKKGRKKVEKKKRKPSQSAHTYLH